MEAIQMELKIKNHLKLCFFFCLLVLSKSALSNTVEKALEADGNNEYLVAVEIWTGLANKGNAIAKYNLASYYSNGKGVKKDLAISKKWLKAATNTGLAEAYLSLNEKALASASGTQITFKSGPLFWLGEQEPGKYTIQLASSRNEKSIEKIYEENHLMGKGGYYHYQNDGVDRYAVIYGTYDTVAEAKQAIEDLPEDLRKKSPWVRNIKSLQKISIKE